MTFAVSVGQVSGVIAALIFVLQILLPNALILLLVGILKNEHTVVTWSVVQRHLLTSLWPTVLNSDTTATRGVSITVRLLTWLRPLGLTLVAVAAIVTPLGLYQAQAPERHVQHVPMKYVADPGPMGYGTPPRSDAGFSRSCGDFGPLQCPGTTVLINQDVSNLTDGSNFLSNATVPNDDYDMRIPKVLAELYQSGLSEQQSTVSSFFDIETRYYGFSKSNQKTPYLGDSFRYLSTVILNNKVEPFEGLIVDTVNGGVGFRNHTVPVIPGTAADWYEDLLWIEPETVCVNTNLSVEMTAPYGGSSDPENITLIDEGGFANINTTYPECDLADTQKDPQLYCRAHKAAWMTSAWSMLIMNITRPNPGAFSYINSHVGARWPLVESQTRGASLTGISLSSTFNGIIDPGTILSNYTLEDSPGANYTNPFNITSSNFTTISTICSGAGGRDITNITNIYVECGLVFGAPARIDGIDTLIYEPKKVYKQPIYSCASTNKASIKTVHLKYNATMPEKDTLTALTVLDVKPKEYANKESMPLWGVETVDFALIELQQFWGLISKENEKAANISTIRQEHLYLPGYMGLLKSLIYGFDYIPGNTGPAAALNSIYGSSTQPIDYTGTTNVAMYVRWRDMSRNASTVKNVLNLIWTDVAANLLVGTRNWNTKSLYPSNLQKRDTDSLTGPNGEVLAPVTVYYEAVRYHWYYGIPAVLSVILVGLIVTAAFFMVLFQRATPGRIQYYVYHLSAGRLLASLQYPGECDREAPTKEWLNRVGKRPSDIRMQAPMASSVVQPLFTQQTAYQGGPPQAPYDMQQQNTDYYPHAMMRANPDLTTGSASKGYMKIDTDDQGSDEVLIQQKH